MSWQPCWGDHIPLLPLQVVQWYREQGGIDTSHIFEAANPAQATGKGSWHVNGFAKETVVPKLVLERLKVGDDAM